MIIWTGGSPHIKGLPHLPGPPPAPLPPLHLHVNTPQVCKQFGKVYKVPNSLNLTTNYIFENYAAEGHRFLIPLARIKFPLVQYIVHNYSFIYLVNYFFIYFIIYLFSVIFTRLTRTRITQIPRQLQMNFLSLDQNFTEIYPDNSISGSWSPTVKTLKLTSKQFDFHWCNEQITFYRKTASSCRF